MKQPTTGYLIARTKQRNEFFISSSAYDRPQWKPLTEATVYPTADIAQNAVTKLFKNGCYEARLVPLQEAMDFEFPNGEKITTPHRGVANSPPKNNAYPKDDLVSDPGSEGEPSDEMTSDEHEDVCSGCGHEPCTCEKSDEEGHCPECGSELGGEDTIDDSVVGDDTGPDADVDVGDDEFGGDEPPMGSKELRQNHEEEENAFSRSKFSRGHTVMYKGVKHKVLDDSGTGVAVITPVSGPANPTRVSNTMLTHVTEAEFKMPAKPQLDAQPSENKTTAATYGAKIDKMKQNKPSMTDAPFDQGGDPHDTKVTIPANVVSDLKAAIDSFEKEAEFSNTRDDAKASFCMTTAEAMKALLAYLELGNIDGIKRAQIALTSMMSPIVNHVPTSVLKFIHMGGNKPTLKDLFDAKRQEKKSQ